MYLFAFIKLDVIFLLTKHLIIYSVPLYITHKVKFVKYKAFKGIVCCIIYYLISHYYLEKPFYIAYNTQLKRIFHIIHSGTTVLPFPSPCYFKNFREFPTWKRSARVWFLESLTPSMVQWFAWWVWYDFWYDQFGEQNLH